MPWVRRAEAVEHTCSTPDRGRMEDLWRCDDCRTLWELDLACAACRYYGAGRHGGQCQVGLEWRAAGLLQRLRYWLEER